MKIEINTEAELDIDALADALRDHVENQIESSIDCAFDNYDFRDIVRDEVNDMDLSYEVDSVLDARDDLIRNNEIVELEDRIKELEETISRIGSVLPNKALDASLQANEELSKLYSDLVDKAKHFIGVAPCQEENPYDGDPLSPGEQSSNQI
tara:strand:+ start:2647 stop:3102 length:456 start_codon:yes stop_codon:yes gene_type:complete